LIVEWWFHPVSWWVREWGEALSAIATSFVICAVLVGGVLVGALLRRVLPEHHLDTHAKDVVRLGCALIATISGLVLGLLINSAKTNFDTQRDEIRQLTANIILLDHLLTQFGPEARPARGLIRDATAGIVDRIWSDGTIKPAHNAPFTSTAVGVAADRAIRSLSPTTDAQRVYQSQAIQTVNVILQARLILYEQSSGRMPTPFLAVLVFWLFILFVSFSLFSPLSPAALAALVVIALSASGAIFLILEMYQPFSGIMQIDSEPLRQALAPLTQ
jgi:hypothetical protein